MATIQRAASSAHAADKLRPRHVPKWLIVGALAASAIACKGQGGGQPTQVGGPGPVSTAQRGAAELGGSPGVAAAVEPTAVTDSRPFGQDPVSWLDLQAQLELPRSTQPEAIPLPWREVTPTAPAVPAAGADGKPKLAEKLRVHEWTAHVLLAGRLEVFAGNEVLGKVRCRADPTELCTAQGLRGPTGKQALDFDPADLDEQGHLKWLTAATAARGWAGKPVLILADRRLGLGAVLQLRETLQAAGAQPVLVSATLLGGVAKVLPEPGSQPVEVAMPATPADAQQSAPADVDTAAGRVPRDVVGVVVQVRRNGGVHLELRRPAPLPSVTPELLGSVLESLNIWAERVRTTAPNLRLATIEAGADAPWEEVVRAIDALRDSCAHAAKGTPCHEPRAFFSHIELRIGHTDAPAAAPSPAGDKAPTPPPL